MLKFKGDEKYARMGRNVSSLFKSNSRHWHNHPSAIPTVDEVEEVTAAMTADTILQVLHGQGIYYGYEIEHDYDNEIPKRAPYTPVKRSYRTEIARKRALLRHFDYRLNKAHREIIRRERRLQKDKLRLHPRYLRKKNPLKGKLMSLDNRLKRIKKALNRRVWDKNKAERRLERMAQIEAAKKVHLTRNQIRMIRVLRAQGWDEEKAVRLAKEMIRDH